LLRSKKISKLSMYLEDLKTYRCNNKCNKEESNQGHLMHQDIYNEEVESKAKENGLEVIYTDIWWKSIRGFSAANDNNNYYMENLFSPFLLVLKLASTRWYYISILVSFITSIIDRLSIPIFETLQISKWFICIDGFLFVWIRYFLTMMINVGNTLLPVRSSDCSDLSKTFKFEPPAHMPRRDYLLLFSNE
jgi:hypothetical protein